jgi:hypothetical protein
VEEGVMTLDPTKPEDLAELLDRGFVVVMDARALPVCVTVHTDHGPRHFHGPDVARALAQAHHALSPRVTVADPGDAT